MGCTPSGSSRGCGASTAGPRPCARRVWPSSVSWGPAGHRDRPLQAGARRLAPGRPATGGQLAHRRADAGVGNRRSGVDRGRAQLPGQRRVRPARLSAGRAAAGGDRGPLGSARCRSLAGEPRRPRAGRPRGAFGPRRGSVRGGVRAGTGDDARGGGRGRAQPGGGCPGRGPRARSRRPTASCRC